MAYHQRRCWRFGKNADKTRLDIMIYKISKIETFAEFDGIPYLKCFTQTNIGIVIWGNHPIGNGTISTILQWQLPFIIELNPIELEASYRIQAQLGVIISVPSDYKLKFLMHVV
jgi:hypothetical protein